MIYDENETHPLCPNYHPVERSIRVGGSGRIILCPICRKKHRLDRSESAGLRVVNSEVLNEIRNEYFEQNGRPGFVRRKKENE